MSDVGIVVGAGGEIGAACALALAPSHSAVLCVDRDERAAETTAAQIRQAGGVAAILVLDAGEPGFATSVVTAARELGAVRAAVHAIAHEEHVSALDITLDSIRTSFALGPIAAFSLFRELHAGGDLAAGAALTVIGSLHATRAFRQHARLQPCPGGARPARHDSGARMGEQRRARERRRSRMDPYTRRKPPSTARPTWMPWRRVSPWDGSEPPRTSPARSSTCRRQRPPTFRAPSLLLTAHSARRWQPFPEAIAHEDRDRFRSSG